MILFLGSLFSGKKIEKRMQVGALELYTFSLGYLGYLEG